MDRGCDYFIRRKTAAKMAECSNVGDCIERANFVEVYLAYAAPVRT